MTTLHSKAKTTQLNKILSDQTLSKSTSRKKKLATSRSEKLEGRDSNKIVFNSQDSKVLHNINLQIPSANSPNVSNSIGKKVVKKEACIKGYTSKIAIKSPKNLIKTKKSLNLKESGKIKDFFSDSSEKNDRNSMEKGIKRVKVLENELKKALDENKKLKKVIQNEIQNEETIEDLMKGFKSRLMKFLYE
jgi:hypothetical protein